VREKKKKSDSKTYEHETIPFDEVIARLLKAKPSLQKGKDKKKAKPKK
jgi:hypothetical protein